MIRLGDAFSDGLRGPNSSTTTANTFGTVHAHSHITAQRRPLCAPQFNTSFIAHYRAILVPVL